jgi:hypothetical protein
MDDLSEPSLVYISPIEGPAGITSKTWGTAASGYSTDCNCSAKAAMFNPIKRAI